MVYNNYVFFLTHKGTSGETQTLPVVLVPTREVQSSFNAVDATETAGPLRAFYWDKYPMIVVRCNSSTSVDELSDSLFHEFFH